jgi:hypothetical protein
MISHIKSLLSPLRYGSQEALTDAQRSSLQEVGVLDGDGDISSVIRPTLVALAQTNAYARVRLVAWDELFEQMTYFAPDDQPAVSLTTRDEGVLVRNPAATEEALGILTQLIGESEVGGCPLRAELSVSEALTLAAMVDGHRKSVLRAFIEGTPFEPSLYDARAISEAVRDGIDSVDWLVTVVRTISDYEAALSEEDVAAALSSLAERHHVVREGHRYALGQGALAVGKRLLVIDHILTLDAGSLTEGGGLATTGFTCLQSGVHHLLLVEHREGVVRFSGVSSADLLASLRQSLTQPEALREMAERVAPSPETGRTCPTCGASLLPDQPFCGACGAPVGESAIEQPQIMFCTGCGQPLDPDARFCTACGAEVD